MRDSIVCETAGWAETFSTATVVPGPAGFTFESQLRRVHQVTFTRDVFAPDNPLLRDSIGERSALVVAGQVVDQLYGERIRAYFGSRIAEHAIEYTVLRRAEATKTLDAAIDVCERAAQAGLHRLSPIVAVGGGVCSDICGLAADLHHRGIPRINVPTTLTGMIDAGIGLKCAVNHGGRKSALGAFHPPERTLIDAGLLASLPTRELASGLAEIVKLAVASDAPLFGVLAEDLPTLMASRFRSPARSAWRVLRGSVEDMLRELALNPFEIADFRRKVDFGHTFSPYFEGASGHAILHGEAVAMDIALSAAVACERGRLTPQERDQILGMLRAAGLALTWPGTSVDDLWHSLASIVEHRNGDLNLVIPTAIGDCDYLGLLDINPELLQVCHDWLEERYGR